MSFTGPSLPLGKSSTERAINLVPVPVESANAARKSAYRDLPGLTLKATLSGAIRGGIRSNGRTFVVDGSDISEVSSTYVATSRGTIGGTGWADWAENQTQLAVTAGGVLKVMDRSGTSFATVANYPGGPRIDVLNEYLLCTEPNTGRFWWSAVGDADDLPALNFATAESSPDNIICPIVTNEEVLLIGLDGSEIWHATGGDEVFSRRAIIEVGSRSPYTPRRLDNSVFWVGSSEEHGQGIVYRLNGYTPSRISNRWVEEKLASVDLTQAYGFAMYDQGQAQYWLQCPGLDTTLVYDVMTSAWFESAELVAGDFTRHRADMHVYHGDTHIMGDADGKLYKLDRDAHTNAGDTLARARIMPNITSATNRRLRFAELECICDVATGGTLLVRWSDDNGENFGSWHQISLGATGNYKHRVRKLAMGSARNRVFELRVTDDVAWNPIDVIVRAV